MIYGNNNNYNINYDDDDNNNNNMYPFFRAEFITKVNDPQYPHLTG
jgi:hypothetical protein